MGVTLRDYQQKAVDDVRAAMRAHRRVLLVSPTGSGKTVIFSHLAERVWSKGLPVTLQAHRIEIVEQISEALRRNNVGHGIIAPGYPETHLPVQVAMVQTLANRIGKLRKPALLITDEAHHATAGTYRKINDFWRDVYQLGTTATPERLDGKGLKDVYDVMVMGPSVAELMTRGYLSRYQYFAPPVVAEIDNIKSRCGDFVAEEIAAAMDQRKVTGDAEQHYRKYLNGRPAVVFCSTVPHAQHVAEQFRAMGWKAEAVDGTMDKVMRRDRIKAIGDGRLNLLMSCDLVSEGTDIPAVAGAILLRPTASLVIALQQDGRVLRPNADGLPSVILDHVNNWIRHGLPDADRVWSLEGAGDRSKRAVSVRQCAKCYFAFAPAPKCPNCGLLYPVKAKKRAAPEVTDGDLQQVTEHIKIAPLKEVMKGRSTWAAIDEVRKARGYHPAWTNRQMQLRGGGYRRSGP